MAVDRQLGPMLEAAAPMMGMDWSNVDVVMLRQAASHSMPAFTLIDLPGIEALQIEAAGQLIEGRLYRPSLAPGLPAILFLHGGGWVMGTLQEYEHFCRHLAHRSGCAVLSLAYRLAPEQPFPAAVDDSYAGLQWLAANATRLGLDADRLAIAGDSAGGNLAAVVTLLARDRRGPVLRHQLLFYPVIDPACNSSSYRENDKYLLTPAMMRWYWRLYLGDRAPHEARNASPMAFASHAGLPTATIITAEYDPLRDEGEAYASALERAGVAVDLQRAPGMIHGFAVMLGIVDAADRWLSYAAERTGAALKTWPLGPAPTAVHVESAK